MTQNDKTKWRHLTLIALALATLALTIGATMQTPFYQKLEQLNPANHRH